MAAALAEHIPHVAGRGVTDLLLDVAMAAAAWSFGWIGGLAALSLSLVGFAWEPRELIERAVVLVAVALARGVVARLRRSEKKLRALLASMDDRILIIDGSGTVTEVVETHTIRRFRSADELVGRPITELFSAEEATRFVDYIRTALDEQRTIYHEYTLPLDGRTCWFSAAVSPLTDDLVLWVARDITAQKTAQEELQRINNELELRVEQRTRDLKSTETRYRSIVEQANDIIFTLTRDRKVTSLNPAFTRVTGHEIGNWLARDIIDLVVLDQRPRAAEQFRRALTTGSLGLTMVGVVDAEGRTLVLEVSLGPQVIDGRNVGFLGFARDVTQRERANADRRRNEELLADSQRIAKLGSWEMDLGTQRLWWSDETYRILGIEPSARPLSVDDFINLLVQDDRARLDAVNEELYAKGSLEWEMRVFANGHEKVLRCNARVTDKHRIVGTVQDITEKQEAEEQLRLSEERFRLLARATSDAIYDFDLCTGNVWRGEGYEKLFGYAPGSLVPRVEAFRELVHPEDIGHLSAAFREAVESGQLSFTHEYRFRRADGSYANIFDRGYVVRDRDKRPLRVLGAMIDLTETKQMSEQLEQAKRLSSLGRLAGSIAHEFNNVLMGVGANAEIISRRASEDLRPVAGNVLGAVRRGRRITEEILRYMRPADPEPKALNVRDFLDQWRDEIWPTLRNRLDIRLDVPIDELWIRADPEQIAQVFTNMAFNARDAMTESRGMLTVRAEIATSYTTFTFGVVKTPDCYIHFQVTDNGAGIPDEQRAHIFEPLYTTKREGTGLGLAVSYQIVARSQGHIFVESEVGVGTTFHIFLPLCSPEVDALTVDQESQLSALGRVLLVEDEPEVAAGISMLLEADGAEVAVVNSGAETIPAIERFDPDVVILDIGLPDVDGVEVYEGIADRWPTLRVLFSSGHAQARNLEHWLAQPNVALLVKPYEMADLRDALTRLRDAVVVV